MLSNIIVSRLHHILCAESGMLPQQQPHGVYFLKWSIFLKANLFFWQILSHLFYLLDLYPSVHNFYSLVSRKSSHCSNYMFSSLF
jgi:hypothetical protein